MAIELTKLNILIILVILSKTSHAYLDGSSEAELAECPREQVSLDCMKSANQENPICVKVSSTCRVFNSNANCETSPFQYELKMVNQSDEMYLSEYKLQNGTSSLRCSLFNEKTKMDFEMDKSGKIVVTSLPWKGCYTVKNPNGNYDRTINAWKESKKVFSVETKFCIIVYPSSNCNSSGMMINPLPGNLKEADFTNFNQTLPHGIQSFRACQDWERTGEVKIYQRGGTPAHITFPRNECSLVLLNKTVKMVKSSECLMLYEEESCKSFGNRLSFKLDPNKIISLPLNFNLKSFRQCTPEEKGVQEEIKFFGKTKDNFKSYLITDICGCIELPHNFTIISVEIQEACISFYSDRECSRYGFSVQGGTNYVPDFITHIEANNGQYQSFKLCQLGYVKVKPNPNFELKMMAFKFQVINVSNKVRKENVEKVKLGEDEYFANSSRCETTTFYAAGGNITESVSVEWIKHVQSVVDEPLVEFINVGTERTHIPNRLKTLIRSSFSSIFALRESCDAVDILTVTEQREFWISKTFQIPPCNDDKYKLESFVEVASVIMEYDVFVNVSGRWSDGRAMMSTELMKYVEGEFRILWKEGINMTVRRRGKIFVRYGVKPGFHEVEEKNKGFQIKVYFKQVLTSLLSMITSKTWN